MMSDNISSNSPFFVNIYEELQDKYLPGDIHSLSFDKSSLESIERLKSSRFTPAAFNNVQYSALIVRLPGLPYAGYSTKRSDLKRF